ncbi:putative response regulator receiver [Klebsiella pneumoniae]|nr:putative response regulator receiver [Klebsiella pneumoniae]
MALRLAIIEDNADLLDELLAWLGYRGFEVWGDAQRRSLLAATAQPSGGYRAG